MVSNFFRSSRVAAEEQMARDANTNALTTNQSVVRLMRLQLITVPT
jgi:hypothetical protein